MTDTKQFTLTGKAYYLRANTPNELSGKYQMDLSIDQETVDKLLSVGVTIKNKNDIRGDFVTLTKAYETKDGKILSPPKLLDSDKNEFPSSVLVGNGSDVKVITHLFEWKFKSKTGTSLGLDTVQILNLIPYEPKNLSLLDD